MKTRIHQGTLQAPTRSTKDLSTSGLRKNFFLLPEDIEGQEVQAIDVRSLLVQVALFTFKIIHYSTLHNRRAIVSPLELRRQRRPMRGVTSYTGYICRLRRGPMATHF
jgi:hypothetical protein